MKLLEGRIALVTGASRGLGRAIALALAQAGADIAVNFRERVGDAEQVARLIRESGRRAIAIEADVARSSEVEGLITKIERELGAVAILVNNAGIAKPQALENLTEQDFEYLLRVNLTSAFLLTQRVLSSMRAARYGRIINVSSVAAQVGGVVGPHYAASKAGMIGLTHSYAGLLAKEGITANAIAPALIETEMVTANPKARPDLIPVGRFGAADEVASVAVLLASNGYITGQTVNVNGGWYMSS